MTIDELINLLRQNAVSRRGDADVLIWDRHSQTSVKIEHVTSGLDGTVYLQGEFVEWDDKEKKWRADGQ